MMEGIEEVEHEVSGNNQVRFDVQVAEYDREKNDQRFAEIVNNLIAKYEPDSLGMPTKGVFTRHDELLNEVNKKIVWAAIHEKVGKQSELSEKCEKLKRYIELEQKITPFAATFICSTAVLAALGHGAIASSEGFKLFELNQFSPVVYWSFAMITSFKYIPLEEQEDNHFYRENLARLKYGSRNELLMLGWDALKKRPIANLVFFLGALADGFIAMNSVNELNGFSFDGDVTLPSTTSWGLSGLIGLASIMQFFIVEGTSGKRQLSGKYCSKLFDLDRNYLNDHAGKYAYMWIFFINVIAFLGSTLIGLLAFNNTYSLFLSSTGNAFMSLLISIFFSFIYTVADFTLFSVDLKELAYHQDDSMPRRLALFLSLKGLGVIVGLLTFAFTTFIFTSAFKDFLYFLTKDKTKNFVEPIFYISFFAGAIRGIAGIATHVYRFLSMWRYPTKFNFLSNFKTARLMQFLFVFLTKIIIELFQPTKTLYEVFFSFALPAFLNGYYLHNFNKMIANNENKDLYSGYSDFMRVIVQLFNFIFITFLSMGFECLLDLTPSFSKEFGITKLEPSELISAIFCGILAVLFGCLFQEQKILDGISNNIQSCVGGGSTCINNICNFFYKKNEKNIKRNEEKTPLFSHAPVNDAEAEENHENKRNNEFQV